MSKSSPHSSGTTLGDTTDVDSEKADHLIQLERLSEMDWEKHLENPRRFTSTRKWKNALIISFTGFLSTTGSSILVAAMEDIALEFNERNQQVVVLTIALYVLGLGFGPFLFAPLSELYGRQTSYIYSMIGFTIVNLGCIWVNSLSGLIILRFLAGCFGSAAPTLGIATISDLFDVKERGKPFSIYAIGPILGPSLGSLIGNYLVLLEWRACFIFLSILVGLNTLSIIFLMDESYSPVVRAGVEAKMNSESSKVKEDRSSRFKMAPATKNLIARTFSRPPRVFFNPIFALVITYYAYIYAIIYVFIVSLPLLFSVHSPPKPIFSYNWPLSTAGLCYVALGIGFLSAATASAYYQDLIYNHFCEKNSDEGRPEYRLIITQIGMFIFPVGLLLWGWTAEAHAHFILPLIGSVIFAFGLMLAFNSCQAFLVDSAGAYAASVMAAASLARSVCGCILPIFSEDLFLRLGYGFSGTLLACISLLVLPFPFIMFRYGERLRKRFKFEP